MPDEFVPQQPIQQGQAVPLNPDGTPINPADGQPPPFNQQVRFMVPPPTVNHHSYTNDKTTQPWNEEFDDGYPPSLSNTKEASTPSDSAPTTPKATHGSAHPYYYATLPQKKHTPPAVPSTPTLSQTVAKTLATSTYPLHTAPQHAYYYNGPYPHNAFAASYQ